MNQMKSYIASHGILGVRTEMRRREEEGPDWKGPAMRTARLLAALCATALAAAPASAALPPNHQRIAELRAILAHPGVAGAFGMSAPIERIEYVRTDFYRVSAGRCRLDVRIVGLPMPRGMVGARRFEVRPGERVCGR
jgi:hypothetical protein